MSLQLFNTLSGKLEEFQPAEKNEVRMYSCGPTVYDYGHIGNFRTFVFVDVLRRFLRQSGYQLKHVMNITDVDDKIIHNAAAQHLSVTDYGRRFEDAFLEDMKTLNLEQPEQLPRATEHIEEMAKYIARLVKAGFAYRTEDGSYYFRIATFPAYGKLSKKDLAGMTDGARVDLDEYEKDNARDFALWKAPRDGEASWESSIGPGRPGWHIECSVMSMRYLGDSFDMHLGGEDLIFPHHENEIAQSESLTGKPLARFWVHARFLLVEGEKMSKSKGNFYTLRDLLLKGHKASSIRYLLASVPYQRQLNFTFDGLQQAAHSVERLRNFKLRLLSARLSPGSNPALAALADKTRNDFREALNDDLNTAQALGIIFDMVREANAAADAGDLKQEDASQFLAVLGDFDQIFAVLHDDDAAKSKQAFAEAEKQGLAVAPHKASAAIADGEIEALVAQRSEAKRAKDFARADALRAQLAEAGIVLEDTKDGVRWKRK